MFFKKKKEEEPEVDPVDAPEEQKGPETLTESKVKEKLADGWIRALVTFELVGKPREHIENTLKSYLANIKNDSRIMTIREEFADAIEQDDGFFSAFCEYECVVETMEVMTWLAINFMPASIEILDPEHIKLEGRIIGNWFNDLLAKLHEVSNVLREERGVNAHITQGMNALIKNAIVLALKGGEKTSKQLEKVLGIPAKQLEPFLTHLVDKGGIIQKNNKYALP